MQEMQEVQDTQVQSLGWEVPLRKKVATRSSFPAGKIPWIEKLGELQSMGSQESDTIE